MRVRLIAGLLVVGAALVPLVARASDSVNIEMPLPPIGLPAPPALVVVPGVPAILYAPSVKAGLFFHQKRWYYWHGGYWYMGPSWKGPWMHIVGGKLPTALVKVPASF